MPNIQKLNAIVIEDILAVRTALTSYLARYTPYINVIKEFENADGVIEFIIENQSVQIIFIDLLLPVTNGDKLIQMIPNLSTIFAVVGVTASPAEFEEFFKTKVGATTRWEVLAKPLDILMITEIAKKLYEAWSLNHSLMGVQNIIEEPMSHAILEVQDAIDTPVTQYISQSDILFITTINSKDTYDTYKVNPTDDWVLIQTQEGKKYFKKYEDNINNLTDLLKHLQRSSIDFLRINQSEILNMRCVITSRKNDGRLLTPNKTFLVKGKYKDEIKEYEDSKSKFPRN